MDKYWKCLNVGYMTEESDDPSNPNIITEHKLPWRSKSTYYYNYIMYNYLLLIIELNDFITTLDKRLEDKQAPIVGVVAKKERVINIITTTKCSILGN